jgi:hypothetical protein
LVNSVAFISFYKSTKIPFLGLVFILSDLTQFGCGLFGFSLNLIPFIL